MSIYISLMRTNYQFKHLSYCEARLSCGIPAILLSSLRRKSTIAKALSCKKTFGAFLCLNLFKEHERVTVNGCLSPYSPCIKKKLNILWVLISPCTLKGIIWVFLNNFRVFKVFWLEFPRYFQRFLFVLDLVYNLMLVL